MSQFHFRELNAEEVPVIARLVNDAYRPKSGVIGWTHESGLISGDRINATQIERLIRQESSVVLLGLSGSQAVACVHVEGHGVEAHIGMLAVEPALQEAGAGTALLAYAEEYAANIFGAKYFVLAVLEARKELVAFYLRRGYERTAKVFPYPRKAGVGTPMHDASNVVELRKRYNNSFKTDTPDGAQTLTE